MDTENKRGGLTASDSWEKIGFFEPLLSARKARQKSLIPPF
jgi:hypothetical protein